MQKAEAIKWTREHLLIALNLYCKLPFGSFSQSNPIIREVAAKLGRSPGSLAMKLCNFTSLDPVQRARGIEGLSGASRVDRALWAEFHAPGLPLAEESEQRLHELFTDDEAKEVDFLGRDRVRLTRPPCQTEVQATVSLRRGQQFFRQAVLTAYEVRCCITGIGVPRLLVASHILPWARYPADRLNPRNGLCLSTLHDAAFDDGLITLDEQRRLVLSPRLRGHFPQSTLEQNFVPFEGRSIRLPDKLAEPEESFLRIHRTEIFQS